MSEADELFVQSMMEQQALIQQIHELDSTRRYAQAEGTKLVEANRVLKALVREFVDHFERDFENPGFELYGLVNGREIVTGGRLLNALLDRARQVLRATPGDSFRTFLAANGYEGEAYLLPCGEALRIHGTNGYRYRQQGAMWVLLSGFTVTPEYRDTFLHSLTTKEPHDHEDDR